MKKIIYGVLLIAAAVLIILASLDMRSDLSAPSRSSI